MTETPDSEPQKFGLKGLAIIAVVVPGMFWMGFGRIDGFAIGFTAFLVLLAAAIEYLPGITDKMQAAQDAAAAANPDGPPPAVQRRWYDALGVLWMLAIPFGPAFSWIITNWIGVDRGNWENLLGFTTLLCVVIPVVGVLPLLRYLKRETALVGGAILAVGTAFPVAMGATSAYDFLHGPEWQQVEITELQDVDYMTGTGTRMYSEAVYFKLADGRTLTHSDEVSPRYGAARLLVLPATAHVIDAQPRNVSQVLSEY